jgi:hypothetical protein
MVIDNLQIYEGSETPESDSKAREFCVARLGMTFTFTQA